MDFSLFRRQSAGDGGICHVERVVITVKRDVPVDGRFGEAQFGVRTVGERDVAGDGRIRQRDGGAGFNRQRSRRQAAAVDVPVAGSAERGVDRERVARADFKIVDRQRFAAGNLGVGGVDDDVAERNLVARERDVPAVQRQLAFAGQAALKFRRDVFVDGDRMARVDRRAFAPDVQRAGVHRDVRLQRRLVQRDAAVVRADGRDDGVKAADRRIRRAQFRASREADGLPAAEGDVFERQIRVVQIDAGGNGNLKGLVFSARRGNVDPLQIHHAAHVDLRVGVGLAVRVKGFGHREVDFVVSAVDGEVKALRADAGEAVNAVPARVVTERHVAAFRDDFAARRFRDGDVALFQREMRSFIDPNVPGAVLPRERDRAAGGEFADRELTAVRQQNHALRRVIRRVRGIDDERSRRQRRRRVGVRAVAVNRHRVCRRGAQVERAGDVRRPAVRERQFRRVRERQRSRSAEGGIRVRDAQRAVERDGSRRVAVLRQRRAVREGQRRSRGVGQRGEGRVSFAGNRERSRVLHGIGSRSRAAKDDRFHVDGAVDRSLRAGVDGQRIGGDGRARAERNVRVEGDVSGALGGDDGDRAVREEVLRIEGDVRAGGQGEGFNRSRAAGNGQAAGRRGDRAIGGRNRVVENDVAACGNFAVRQRNRVVGGQVARFDINRAVFRNDRAVENDVALSNGECAVREGNRAVEGCRSACRTADVERGETFFRIRFRSRDRERRAFRVRPGRGVRVDVFEREVSVIDDFVEDRAIRFGDVSFFIHRRVHGEGFARADGQRGEIRETRNSERRARVKRDGQAVLLGRPIARDEERVAVFDDDFVRDAVERRRRISDDDRRGFAFRVGTDHELARFDDGAESETAADVPVERDRFALEREIRAEGLHLRGEVDTDVCGFERSVKTVRSRDERVAHVDAAVGRDERAAVQRQRARLEIRGFVGGEIADDDDGRGGFFAFRREAFDDQRAVVPVLPDGYRGDARRFRGDARRSRERQRGGFIRSGRSRVGDDKAIHAVEIGVFQAHGDVRAVAHVEIRHAEFVRREHDVFADRVARGDVNVVLRAVRGLRGQLAARAVQRGGVDADAGVLTRGDEFAAFVERDVHAAGRRVADRFRREHGNFVLGRFVGGELAVDFDRADGGRGGVLHRVRFREGFVKFRFVRRIVPADDERRSAPERDFGELVGIFFRRAGRPAEHVVVPEQFEGRAVLQRRVHGVDFALRKRHENVFVNDDVPRRRLEVQGRLRIRREDDVRRGFDGRRRENVFFKPLDAAERDVPDGGIQRGGAADLQIRAAEIDGFGGDVRAIPDRDVACHGDAAAVRPRRAVVGRSRGERDGGQRGEVVGSRVQRRASAERDGSEIFFVENIRVRARADGHVRAVGELERRRVDDGSRVRGNVRSRRSREGQLVRGGRAVFRTRENDFIGVVVGNGADGNVFRGDDALVADCGDLDRAVDGGNHAVAHRDVPEVNRRFGIKLAFFRLFRSRSRARSERFDAAAVHRRLSERGQRSRRGDFPVVFVDVRGDAEINFPGGFADADFLVSGKFQFVIAVDVDGVDVELCSRLGKVENRRRSRGAAADDEAGRGSVVRVDAVARRRDVGAFAERKSFAANPNLVRVRRFAAEVERSRDDRFALDILLIEVKDDRAAVDRSRKIFLDDLVDGDVGRARQRAAVQRETVAGAFGRLADGDVVADELVRADHEVPRVDVARRFDGDRVFRRSLKRNRAAFGGEIQLAEVGGGLVQGDHSRRVAFGDRSRRTIGDFVNVRGRVVRGGKVERAAVHRQRAFRRQFERGRLDGRAGFADGQILGVNGALRGNCGVDLKRAVRDGDVENFAGGGVAFKGFILGENRRRAFAGNADRSRGAFGEGVEFLRDSGAVEGKRAAVERRRRGVSRRERSRREIRRAVGVADVQLRVRAERNRSRAEIDFRTVFQIDDAVFFRREIKLLRRERGARVDGERSGRRNRSRGVVVVLVRPVHVVEREIIDVDRAARHDEGVHAGSVVGFERDGRAGLGGQRLDRRLPLDGQRAVFRGDRGKIGVAVNDERRAFRDVDFAVTGACRDLVERDGNVFARNRNRVARDRLLERNVPEVQRVGNRRNRELRSREQRRFRHVDGSVAADGDVPAADGKALVGRVAEASRFNVRANPRGGGVQRREREARGGRGEEKRRSGRRGAGAHEARKEAFDEILLSHKRIFELFFERVCGIYCGLVIRAARKSDALPEKIGVFRGADDAERPRGLSPFPSAASLPARFRAAVRRSRCLAPAVRLSFRPSP